MAQTENRQRNEPDLADVIIRGLFWGAAVAVSSAIFGPVAPAVVSIAMKAMNGDPPDGGATDTGFTG